MSGRIKVVILGAGNVATHIAHALADKTDILQVYNHRIAGAETLASRIGAEAIDSISDLDKSADLYIISVKDDAIPELARSLKGFEYGIWAHTSGSVSMEALDGVGSGHGVIYPLQTFSKDSGIKMSEVPFFLEASSPQAMKLIEETAQLISGHIHYADSNRRCRLHIAAVFACNFTNYMWTQADRLLHDYGLDIRVFRSLISATFEKAMAISPEEGQTGPARRGDKAIMAKHESMLSGETEELYRVLSESIFNHYNITKT
ncbi:MAG: DUF2520 domain-containing protein [Muribaculum sp.]|nr:DUF2520 domain-containing protein [Muribaculum sp.]